MAKLFERAQHWDSFRNPRSFPPHRRSMKERGGNVRMHLDQRGDIYAPLAPAVQTERERRERESLMTCDRETSSFVQK